MNTPSDDSGGTGIPRIDQIMRTATKMRFPTGAFGKTCMLVAIFSLSCAAISWSARTPWVAALALIIVAVVTVAAMWRLFNFADKNPSAAILEGAEFVRHEQMQLAAKGISEIPEDLLQPTNEPENLPLLEEATAATPDPTVKRIGEVSE